MKFNRETTTYAQMGMAALIPGMQYMIEHMQKELDSMREYLGILQTADDDGGDKGPMKNPKRVKGSQGPWKDMTPEERSIEMRRRMAVARGEKPARKQAKPVKDSALSQERRKAWAALSPKKRKERLAKMAAGRQKTVREDRQESAA
jgi:hypothetical protein